MGQTILPRTGITLQDPDDNFDLNAFNANAQKTNDLLGLTICTSTTRPTGFEGRLILETDTKNRLVFQGGAWVPLVVGGTTITVTSKAERDAITAPYNGQIIYRYDKDWIETWTGTSWRVQGLVTTSSLADITNPYTDQLAVYASDKMVYRWTGSAWLAVLHTAVGGGHARYTQTAAMTNAAVAATWVKQAYPVSTNTSPDVTPDASFVNWTINRAGVWRIKAGARIAPTNVNPLRFLFGVFPASTPGTNPYAVSTTIEVDGSAASTNVNIDTGDIRLTASTVVCVALNRAGTGGGGGGNPSSSEIAGEQNHISLRWVEP